jgi:hypothetical protein
MAKKVPDSMQLVSNVLLTLLMTGLFLFKCSVISEVKFMHTVNLFLTLILMLYLGKYFDNDAIY